MFHLQATVFCTLHVLSNEQSLSQPVCEEKIGIPLPGGICQMVTPVSQRRDLGVINIGETRGTFVGARKP